MTHAPPNRGFVAWELLRGGGYDAGVVFLSTGWSHYL